MEVCIADATYSLTAVCQSSTPAGQPQLAAEARGKISRAKPWARILERQKMLQRGQVLFRRLSVDFALVLPFKDSQRGG
jgi:hypothetical protein